MRRCFGLIDFTIALACGKRLAENSVTCSIKPRNGPRIHIQTNRGCHHRQKEQTRAKARGQPLPNRSHWYRLREVWPRSFSWSRSLVKINPHQAKPRKVNNFLDELSCRQYRWQLNHGMAILHVDRNPYRALVAHQVGWWFCPGNYQMRRFKVIPSSFQFRTTECASVMTATDCRRLAPVKISGCALPVGVSVGTIDIVNQHDTGKNRTSYRGYDAG